MKPLTHRERVLTALNHNEPDRVPMDFGGTTVSNIVVPAYDNLKRYLGLNYDTKPVATWGRPWARTVNPDEAVLRMFDIDTRSVTLGNFKRIVGSSVDPRTYIDVWGTTWKVTQGNFFINSDGAFKKCKPSIEILEIFNWPDPNDPGLYEALRERVELLRNSTDFAIVLSPISVAGILNQSMKMRGTAEFLMDLCENREFACRLLDIITNICIRMAENALDAVGKNVDVLFYADDLAHQQSTFVSPTLYREVVKPRHKRFFDALKSKSDAKILMHSDGAVYALIPDLIEIGVDVLNPVQVTAKGMDPKRLKEEFGGRLSFWGAIDTRDLLPFGTPEEIRHEVRRIVDLLGDGGGYVLTSVQAIQAEVPPENIVAMFEEGKSYVRRG